MTDYCFKTKPGTKYDKAIKKNFELRPKWKNVFVKVNKLLGENITKMGSNPSCLYLDPSEIKKEENKKLFTKDGRLKATPKNSKEILSKYKQIIEDEGLTEYEELHFINFSYGFMRLKGQNLESFITSENDIYFKADFELNKRVGADYLIPITEIEYQEKYLEELKVKEAAE